MTTEDDETASLIKTLDGITFIAVNYYYNETGKYPGHSSYTWLSMYDTVVEPWYV